MSIDEQTTDVGTKLVWLFSLKQWRDSNPFPTAHWDKRWYHSGSIAAKCHWTWLIERKQVNVYHDEASIRSNYSHKVGSQNVPMSGYSHQLLLVIWIFSVSNERWIYFRGPQIQSLHHLVLVLQGWNLNISYTIPYNWIRTIELARVVTVNGEVSECW